MSRHYFDSTGSAWKFYLFPTISWSFYSYKTQTPGHIQLEWQLHITQHEYHHSNKLQFQDLFSKSIMEKTYHVINKSSNLHEPPAFFKSFNEYITLLWRKIFGSVDPEILSCRPRSLVQPDKAQWAMIYHRFLISMVIWSLILHTKKNVYLPFFKRMLFLDSQALNLKKFKLDIKNSRSSFWNKSLA